MPISQFVLKMSDDSPPDLDQVLRLLQDRTYTTVSRTELGNKGIIKVKSRSDVWNIFQVVVTSEGNTTADFVQCSKCERILRFKASSGTSHLKRHCCYKQENQVGLPVRASASSSSEHISPSNSGSSWSRSSSSLPSSSRSSMPVPASVKREVKDKCVLMCALDLRPFCFVEGRGFQKLAQRLTSVVGMAMLTLQTYCHLGFLFQGAVPKWLTKFDQISCLKLF